MAQPVSRDKKSVSLRQDDGPTDFNPIWPRQKVCSSTTKNRPSLICKNSSYPTQPHSITTQIIIHSKYFPVSDWIKPHTEFTITRCCLPNLERIFAILNQWRQKCSPLQIIEPLTEKTWGGDCVIFVEQKNKEHKGEPSRTGKYFESIIIRNYWMRLS